MAMLLFLVGESLEDVPVLGIGLSGLVLGKTAHIPTVAPPQQNLRALIGDNGRGENGLLAGNQRVDSLQTGHMGLLLPGELVGKGGQRCRQLLGKFLVGSGILHLLGNQVENRWRVSGGDGGVPDPIPDPCGGIGVDFFHRIPPFTAVYGRGRKYFPGKPLSFFVQMC